MTATVQNRMVKTAFECFIEFAPERVTHPEVAFPLLPSFCPHYGQRPSIYRRPYLLPFLRQRPRRRSSVSLCLSCRSWSFSLLHFQFRRSFLRWERRLPRGQAFPHALSVHRRLGGRRYVYGCEYCRRLRERTVALQYRHSPSQPQTE